jgi:hypothetical protein
MFIVPNSKMNVTQLSQEQKMAASNNSGSIGTIQSPSDIAVSALILNRPSRAIKWIARGFYGSRG